MLSKRCLTILEMWKCKLNKEISTSEEIFESVGIKRSYQFTAGFLRSHQLTVPPPVRKWWLHQPSTPGLCPGERVIISLLPKFLTERAPVPDIICGYGIKEKIWIKFKNKGGKLKRMEGKKRSRVRRWCHIPNHCVISIYHLLGGVA